MRLISYEKPGFDYILTIETEHEYDFPLWIKIFTLNFQTETHTKIEKFIGNGGSWRTYPEFKRCPASLSLDLCDIQTKIEFKQNHPGRFSKDSGK